KFFEKENLQHIALDTAFYTRVSGSQTGEVSGTPGGSSGTRAGEGSGTGGGGPSGAGGGNSPWVQSFEAMPLDAKLWELIRKAVPDAADHKRIYDLIVTQLENDIKDKVQKATRTLEQDKKVL